MQAFVHFPLLSFLLVLCFSAGTLTSAHSRPSNSGVDFIRRSCRATRYPALCVECLASYAPTVNRSPRQLACAALTVSADRARSASAFVTRLSSPGSGSPKSIRSRQAGAVRDCIETMRDSVDRLRRSVREMDHLGGARTGRFAWHLSNVQTWVSAALTDESTCLDSLSEASAGGSARAAIRKKVVEVAQVTSNALALVNQLGPRN